MTTIPTAPPVIITPNVASVRSSESHSPDSNRAPVIYQKISAAMGFYTTVPSCNMKCTGSP